MFRKYRNFTVKTIADTLSDFSLDLVNFEVV